MWTGVSMGCVRSAVMGDDPIPLYVTPGWLARRWATTPANIWRRIHDGRIRALNVGTEGVGDKPPKPKWRIPRSEVERLERLPPLPGEEES